MNKFEHGLKMFRRHPRKVNYALVVFLVPKFEFSKSKSVVELDIGLSSGDKVAKLKLPSCVIRVRNGRFFGRENKRPKISDYGSY